MLGELSALDNRLSRLGSFSGLALSTNITGEAERDADAAIEQGLVEAQNALRFFELEWLQVDDERARPARGQRAAGIAPLLPDLVAALPPAHPQRGRGAHARRARARRAGRLAHALRPGHVDAADPLRRPRPDDLRAARARRARRIARPASAPTTRSSARSSRTPACRRRSTTRSSRIVSRWIACAATTGRAARATSRTSSRPRSSTACSTRSSATTARPPLVAHSRSGCSASSRWCSPTSTRRSVAAGRSTTARRSRSSSASFGEFAPRIERMAHDLFADGRLDAEPRTGKRGGAFCASVAQDARPFILMNFMGKLDDVRTLAHELGHGMQFELTGERQSALSHHPPLALAEVASTFAEHIVFERQLAAGDRPAGAPLAARGPRRGQLRDHLPPDAHGALRGAGVRAARRGQGAPARAAERLLDGDEPSLLRRQRSRSPRATATAGRTSRTSSTRASTPTRTCSPRSRASRSRRSSARTPSASPPPTSTSSASAARRRPRISCGARRRRDAPRCLGCRLRRARARARAGRGGHRRQRVGPLRTGAVQELARRRRSEPLHCAAHGSPAPRARYSSETAKHAVATRERTRKRERPSTAGERRPMRVYGRRRRGRRRGSC